MKRAEAAAAHKEKASPVLGGAPSYVRSSVPAAATSAASTERKPMRRSPWTARS
jgi:hypothetical protein